MNYALYILAGDADKGKVNEFVSDTKIGIHAADAALSVVEDAAGFDFFDMYARHLTHENSVALTGDMVQEMYFKTFIDKHTKYELNANNLANTSNLTDVVKRDVKHVLTVKGNIEMPNLFFALGKETAKKKDASRIWKWANTPIGSADDAYYRDVVATVFATDDRQFRALILKRACVDSYEEYFDKNGEGHFTLVMAITIPVPAQQQPGQQPAQQNVPSIEVQGPSFEQSFTSFMSDVSTVAKSSGKVIDAAADAAEVFVDKDDEEAMDKLKKMRHVAKGAKMASKDIEGAFVDGSAWNPDDELADAIAKHKDYIVDNIIDGKPVEKKKKKKDDDEGDDEKD